MEDNKITVYKLLNYCLEQVARGNGDKVVFISSDDEGNEWHQLFEGFTYSQEDIDACIKYSNTDKYDIERYHKLTDIILLG